MKRVPAFNKFKKAVFITACSLLFISEAGVFTAYAHTEAESRYLSGTWMKDDHGWWFANRGNPDYYTFTWAEYRENSYYFGADGYLVTGWQYINDRWYYFSPYEGSTEGAMIRGWVHDPNYNGWFYTDQNGIMVTGWRKIDGYWYYFNAGPEGTLGLMAVNCVVDDAYVDSDGRMNELR